ncbi:uncharacterized protein LOC141851384 [Brevipalpus obovatus]|uniref:uncharacterized protein LOC141851384 n=1 Tax=Brevipalpus obovatus TaxID=246614 RepID=UPI003D9E6A3C
MRRLKSLIKLNKCSIGPLIDQDSVDRAYWKLFAHVTNLVSGCESDWKKRNIIRMSELAKRKRTLERKISRFKFRMEDSPQFFSELKNDLKDCRAEIALLNKQKEEERIEALDKAKLTAWEAADLVMGREWRELREDVKKGNVDIFTAEREKFMATFRAKCPNLRSHKNGHTLALSWLNRSEWLGVCKRVGRKKCKFSAFLDSKSFRLFLELDENFESFFKFCISKCLIPLGAFCSLIHLIPKADGQKLRPITIMNSFGRTFDCSIYFIIQRNPKLGHFTRQWGFSKKLGVGNIFCALMNNLSSLLNKEQIVIKFIISLDLMNAFENFSIDSCVDKLRSIGVDPCITKLIAKILKGRTSMIYDSNGNPKYKKHTSGSFQGGFLSPWLFNVTSKDIHVSEVDDIKLSTYKYADDMFVVSEDIILPKNIRWSNYRVKRILYLLNTTIDKIINIVDVQCRSVGLSLNKTKSNFCVLTNYLKIARQIPSRSPVRILGLNLSSGLIYNQLRKDSETKITDISRLFERRKLFIRSLPVKYTPILYDALVNSYLRYFSPMLVTKSSSNDINKLCSKTIRYILSAYQSANTETLFWALKIHRPNKIIFDHFLKELRRNETIFRSHNLFPSWVRSAIPYKKSFSVRQDSFPLACSANLSEAAGSIHIKIKAIDNRAWVAIRCSYESSSVDWMEEYLYHGLHVTIQAALSDYLTFSSFLPRDRSDIIIIHCPLEIIWNFSGHRNGSTYVSDALNLYSFKWKISETIIRNIEEVIIVSCGKPNWLASNYDDLMGIEKTTNSKLDIRRDFDMQICNRYDLDYLVLLAGSWYSWSNKRTCLCGGRLSSFHIIWRCTLLQTKKPIWILEYEDFPTQELIRKAEDKRELAQLGYYFERILYKNGIRRPFTRFDPSVEEIMLGCFKSYQSIESTNDLFNKRKRITQEGIEELSTIKRAKRVQMSVFGLFHDHKYHRSSIITSTHIEKAH